MAHTEIRQTHIYLPKEKPGTPCPVAFPRRHPSCRIIGLDLRHSFAHPLTLNDVNYAGIDELHEDYLAGTDHSDDHLLYFVVEGQCWGISQDLQHPLHAGDLFMAPVGHGAWIQLTEGSCKAVWFHTADSDLWQALKSGPVTVQRALDPTGMASVMTLLLREQAGAHPDRESVASHYCSILAAGLRREVQDLESPGDRQAHNRLHRLRALLNDQLEEEWTVARMAEVLNVSGGHLHLLTKQYIKQTPLDILRELRMERAKTLLQSTHFTLDHIAAQVGYRSAYAFSDAFCRHSGLRPGAYRKQV